MKLFKLSKTPTKARRTDKDSGVDIPGVTKPAGNMPAAIPHTRKLEPSDKLLIRCRMLPR